jgi:hypothetical protein
MIKARNTLRPDAACHSADVLTPTERAAERLPRGFTPPQKLVYRNSDMRWGDDPKIRKQLMKIKGKSNAPTS